LHGLIPKELRPSVSLAKAASELDRLAIWLRTEPETDLHASSFLARLAAEAARSKPRVLETVIGDLPVKLTVVGRGEYGVVGRLEANGHVFALKSYFSYDPQAWNRSHARLEHGSERGHGPVAEVAVALLYAITAPIDVAVFYAAQVTEASSWMLSEFVAKERSAICRVGTHYVSVLARRGLVALDSGEGNHVRTKRGERILVDLGGVVPRLGPPPAPAERPRAPADTLREAHVDARTLLPHGLGFLND
jgi:hypothetical protein